MNPRTTIIGSVAASIGALYIMRNQRNKQSLKSAKKAKSNKPNKRKNERKDLVPERRLPDYKLSKKKLNKYERIFLKELKKADSKATIVVKQRPPKRTAGGYIEYAYLIKYFNGERYLVTPKIVDPKTLSYAIHEVCHQSIGHQNPNDIDFYLPTFEKELQVEDCVVDTFNEYQLPYKPRSRRSIRRAYR